LSPSEQQILSKLGQIDRIAFTKVVEANLNILTTPNGRLKISLPNEPGVWVFQIVSSYVQSPRFYTIVGELETVEHDDTFDEECEIGKFSLTRDEDFYLGQFVKAGIAYEITSLNNQGRFALSKYQGVLDEFCGSSTDSVVAQINSNNDRGSECPVRLLIGCTDAAHAKLPDIETRSRNAYYKLLHNLSSSGVSISDLEVQLAGIVRIPSTMYLESNLRSNVYEIPMNIPLQQLRADYKADIMMIISSNVYDGLAGSIMGDPADVTAVNAFAVVQADYVTAAPEEVFAHEFGHLFGCRHHRLENCGTNDDDKDPKIAHGYIAQKGCAALDRRVYYQTVMANCLSSTNNEARFTDKYSNPHIKIRNKRLGTQDRNFNVQHFKDMACTVANYNTEVTPTLFIKASGLTVCVNDLVYFTAVLGNTPAPVIFLWSYSYDGATYSPEIAGDAWYEQYASSTPYSRLFVRVRAGTIGSPLITSEISILSSQEDVYCGRSSSSAETTSVIFPVPVQDVLHIKYEKENILDHQYRVYDCLGKVVKTGIIDNSVDEPTIDVYNIPAGVYFLKILNTSTNSAPFKFIKQ
jgi:Secretion system C-terminal sorting domain/Metallo-peptidase family M12B Reprolysin-like